MDNMGNWCQARTVVQVVALRYGGLDLGGMQTAVPHGGFQGLHDPAMAIQQVEALK